jgi:hypothetical protein
LWRGDFASRLALLDGNGRMMVRRSATRVKTRG